MTDDFDNIFGGDPGPKKAPVQPDLIADLKFTGPAEDHPAPEIDQRDQNADKIEAALEFIPEGEPISYDVATEGIVLDGPVDAEQAPGEYKKPKKEKYVREVKPFVLEEYDLDELKVFFGLWFRFKLVDTGTYYYKRSLIITRIDESGVIFQDENEVVNQYSPLQIGMQWGVLAKYKRLGYFRKEGKYDMDKNSRNGLNPGDQVRVKTDQAAAISTVVGFAPSVSGTYADLDAPIQGKYLWPIVDLEKIKAKKK